MELTVDPGSNRFSKEDFDSALDSAFEVQSSESPGASLEIRLVEVKTLRAPAGYEQFSALFVGPAAPVWPQGTYRLVNARMGALDVFMVPVGRTAAGIQYEVCVSRERDAGPPPDA
jgi:hypothetical protein